MRFSVFLFFLFPLPILTHRHTGSSAGHERTKMEKDLHATVQDGDRKLQVTPVSCCHLCGIVLLSSRVLHWLLFSSLSST